MNQFKKFFIITLLATTYLITAKIPDDRDVIMSVEKQEELDNKLLDYLCGSKPTKIIQKLIDQGANVNAIDSPSGATALMITVMPYNNPNTVGELRTTYNIQNAKLLISYNVSVNTPDNKGSTPLIEAAHWGHTEIVKLLLDNGADINAVNHAGKTALTVALYSPQWHTRSEIVKILLEKITDEQTTQAVLHQIYPWMVISEQKSNDNKNNENNNNSDEHKNESQDNTAKASHEAPIEKAPSIQPSYNLPCFQLRVIEQQHNDCGLHVLANAESINACIKNKRYVYTGFSQQLSPAFYAQAAQLLSTAQAQRDIYNDHLSPIDLITVAKSHFNMNNYCVISLHHPHLCYTTKQPIEHLKAGIPDCSGILNTNKHIQQMIDELKHKDAGAVHFICAINNQFSRPGYLLPDHWILISLVKERGCPKPYMLYLDSNNTPFQQERDAQKHIDYIRTTWSNRLLGSLINP